MKVVILKPEVVDMDPEKIQISAGMVTIIPSISGTEGLEEGDEPNEDNDFMPDFTLAYAGQSLQRKMYEELAREFSSTGGFYDFQVPNLQKRVIMDFTEDGEPILGDVVGYYQTIPEIVKPQRW